MSKKVVQLIEDNVCSLPWVHTEINVQDNRIAPCCKYDGAMGKLSDGFIKVWNNDDYQNLRNSLKTKNNHDACNACANNSVGAFTYKDFKNTSYKKLPFTHECDVDEPFLPAVVNISLSNTCNLACRMCNPISSSKLTQIVKKSDLLKSYNYIPIHSTKFNIENFRGAFTNTKLVSFSGGGEPMFDENCLELVKHISKESTKLTNINFSTNMTVLNKELLAELDSYDYVTKLSVSIDGPEQIHDYIRYGCEWDTILKNFEYIRKNHSRFIFRVNTTISSLNAGYISKTLSTLTDLEQRFDFKFEGIMPSPVLDKQFFNPGLLPDNVKKEYLNRLQTPDTSIPGSEQLIQTTKDMLENQPDGNFKEFINYITEFDRIAKTDFRVVYPELSTF